MKGKEHLTKEGIQKIVSIKAALNNGLPNELKIAFPDTVTVIRPQIKNRKNDLIIKHERKLFIFF